MEHAITNVQIRREDTRVLVLHNGRALLDLPWQAALALARALQVKARLAEEQAKAQLIITDQAILTRAGFKLGLTSRPDLLRAAAHEAGWNRNLRRYIPLFRAKGIQSQEIFGAPRVGHVRTAPPRHEGS